MALPQGPNQRWSLDFLSDAFTDGRRFRILAVVDDFTRECLCLVADTSLSGARVARELDIVVARRGKPHLDGVFHPSAPRRRGDHVTCPLEGVIRNPEYYKNFKQTSKIVALTCAKYLEVLSVHECMFGYQGLLALRKS